MAQKCHVSGGVYYGYTHTHKRIHTHGSMSVAAYFILTHAHTHTHTHKHTHTHTHTGLKNVITVAAGFMATGCWLRSGDAFSWYVLFSV
jgi:hypothetical protein